mmetsp:Transcript_1770/g.3628  ORF Transcript_1770/g.3628 Transcript_1770/m.3628 type:complete len:196 (-) Transcript_1770:255-842(-)
MPSLTRTEDAGLQSYRTLRQTRRAISRARTLQARALVQVEQVRECLDGRVAVQLCGEIGRSRRLALLRAEAQLLSEGKQLRHLGRTEHRHNRSALALSDAADTSCAVQVVDGRADDTQIEDVRDLRKVESTGGRSCGHEYRRVLLSVVRLLSGSSADGSSTERPHSPAVASPSNEFHRAFCNLEATSMAFSADDA